MTRSQSLVPESRRSAYVEIRQVEDVTADREDGPAAGVQTGRVSQTDPGVGVVAQGLERDDGDDAVQPRFRPTITFRLAKGPSLSLIHI